jgi:branched-chain amino acid transport system substrate-binding protein
MTSITRRSLIRASTAAAATAAVGAGALGFPYVVRAAEEATILGLFPTTGPYADSGPLMDKGARIALEQVDYKAGNHKLRYITRDSETKAGAATRRAEEAIASENVKFIVGPWSSGVALAVSEVAKNNKVMHWFSGGTEDISGKRCHRYSFMWAANPWTAMDTVLDAFKRQYPDAKRLYLFVVDYAFGWSLQKYVENLTPKYGLEVIGVDRHPLGQREFSSYITKAAAASPDAVYMINFGLDAISAARQLYSFGLVPNIPVILSWSAGVEELVQLSPEIRSNMLVGTNYYYTLDTPASKAFVEAYKRQDPQHLPPGYAPGAAYALTRMTIEGIRRADSTNVQEAVKALEGAKVDGLVGPTKIEARNHQCIRPYFVLKTKRPDEMQNPYDFGTIIHQNSAPQPRELNECQDIGEL